VVKQVHGLMMRGAAALGVLLLVSGATAAAVELSRDEPVSSTAAAPQPSAEVLKYWADARSALSPLLVYVRILPEAINALEGADGRAKKGQVSQAKDMAESFATARDLVGRLPAPPSVSGNVSELLQVACQLYRQAALEVATLSGDQARPSAFATLRRATSLHLIADRLIDQSRRVLNIDAATAAQAPIELRYAPPVPSLAEITGVADPLDSASRSVADSLAAAREQLAMAAAVAPAHASELTAAAAALEQSDDVRGEDVVGARLAILLGLVADDARAAEQGEVAAALQLLSADVWNAARTLVARPHPAMTSLGDLGGARSKVWTGGAFDGKPPALKPGEDIGSGLPGGLPNVDPVQILRG
jgi:hypothetical protein